jgi:hypothetical protein
MRYGIKDSMMWRYQKREERSSKGPPLIGRNQLSLLKALLHAPGNRFKSLSRWARAKEVVGGGRESRRQSCLAVIHRGWAEVRLVGAGLECTLTPEGRAIATGEIKFKMINRKVEETPQRTPKGPTIAPELWFFMHRAGLDFFDMYRRRN